MSIGSRKWKLSFSTHIDRYTSSLYLLHTVGGFTHSDESCDVILFQGLKEGVKATNTAGLLANSPYLDEIANVSFSWSISYEETVVLVDDRADVIASHGAS